jgi:hypothetical protein
MCESNFSSEVPYTSAYNFAQQQPLGKKNGGQDENSPIKQFSPEVMNSGHKKEGPKSPLENKKSSGGKNGNLSARQQAVRILRERQNENTTPIRALETLETC